MIPKAPLRDRVASIDVVTHGGGALTVLPSTSAVLGFQLRGRVRAEEGLLSTAGVTGLQSAARSYAYQGETVSILVRFTPQGATCLGAPASELARRSLPLDDLLPPSRVREVRERLASARTTGEGVTAVEDLLGSLPFARDPLVDRALARLDASSGGDALVGSVARALGVSERQLERRFLRAVGVTPKRYASLRRFERAIALLPHAPSLASVAFDAGYYDQSHFIRDFRRFAGTSPGRHLRERA